MCLLLSITVARLDFLHGGLGGCYVNLFLHSCVVEQKGHSHGSDLVEV